MTTTEDVADVEAVPPVIAHILTKKFVLKGLLDKAMVVLPTRDVGQGQVLRNFQIEVTGGDDAQLRVAATDLDLWALASTTLVTAQDDAKLVLPGRTLIDIVDAADEDDLAIDVADGVATIKVKRAEWDLRVPDGSKYPTFPPTESVMFHEIPRGPFVDAISRVRYAASTESQRVNLLMIDIRAPKNAKEPARVRATDALRYHQVSLTGWPKGFDLQLPTSAADVLLSLLKTTEAETLEIGETEEQIVFRIDDDVFVSNKFVAQFPNVDEKLVAPAIEGNDQEMVVDRRALLDAIKRVRITSDPETSALALVLSRNKLIVRSKNSSKQRADSASEELDVVWSGDKRTVGFNHKHLTELLRSIDSPSCTFLLGKDTRQKRSPLLLRDEASGTIGVLSQQRPDFTA